MALLWSFSKISMSFFCWGTKVEHSYYNSNITMIGWSPWCLPQSSLTLGCPLFGEYLGRECLGWSQLSLGKTWASTKEALQHPGQRNRTTTSWKREQIVPWCYILEYIEIACPALVFLIKERLKWLPWSVSRSFRVDTFRQVTASWVVQLTWQEEGMVSRGTSRGLMGH